MNPSHKGLQLFLLLTFFTIIVLMNLSSSLSFCLRNLDAAGIAASSRGAMTATDTDPYCILYKGLAVEEISKNDCHIVVKNISASPIEIPAAFTIVISWSRILNNSLAEQSIQWSDRQATSQLQSNWSIKWISEGRSRCWHLTANTAIRIDPGTELAFLAQNIKVAEILTPTDLDISHLSFRYGQSSSKYDEYQVPVILKKLDVSQDKETLPIDAQFTTPRYPEAPNAWNVSQNTMRLLHPSKGENQVFSNTIMATIESRLAFVIRNPAGFPLASKGPNTDPRFVVTIAYGSNVRALSRTEDRLPFSNTIQLNGFSDYIEIPTHDNPTTAITVSVWARSATQEWGSYGGQLITKRDAFILHGTKNSKNLQFYVCLADVGWQEVSFTPSALFDIREWHHYALTYDGNALVLYIDSIECARTSFKGILANANVPMYLGRDLNAGDQGFLKGQLAMACILARACSEDEMQQLMVNQLDGFANDVVASYSLDLITNNGIDQNVADLSVNKCNGLVRGNPTIVPVSPNRSAQKSGSFQGVQLMLDGMDSKNPVLHDTSDIPFTQTVSDSAGIMSWTLRPLIKKILLNGGDKLRLVFEGICPDNTTGEALITIAYYDIKGYKDGYTTLLPSKIEPIPCVISPSKAPLDLELLNPHAGLELTLQFFGLDMVTLYRKFDGCQRLDIGNYPAVMRNYKLPFDDDKLWLDQELITEFPAQTGGTTIYTIAKIRYKAALGVEWQKKIHHSNWVQLQQPIRAISTIHEYTKLVMDEPNSNKKEVKVLADCPARFDAGVNRYCLQYESGQWKLILEIEQSSWWQPSISYYLQPYPFSPFIYKGDAPGTGRYSSKSGGGFFLLENVRFNGSGAAQFTIKNMQIYTKSGGITTIDIEGSVQNIDGCPVLDPVFLRQLSGQCGWDRDPYCIYSLGKPLGNGISRPQPLRAYPTEGSIQEKYPNTNAAERAAQCVYGGYDYFYKNGVLIESTDLCYLYPNNDKSPPVSARSARSLHQAWQGQSLQGHDFSSTMLDQANFDAADLQAANLSCASLVNASLQGARLALVDGTSANLRGATMVSAQMNYAKFERATFDDANLTDASFLGANLAEARFIGAILTGVNFDTALVEGTQFSPGSGLTDDQLEALRLRGAVITDHS